MQTSLPESLLATDRGKTADAVLRSCVHCGFCLATCPTYQLLGNELDSPRGRIYLIKSMLEGNAVSGVTRQHLDRCLTCQACETTCPSGVEYHKLLDIGREEVARRAPRPALSRLFRWSLRQWMPYRRRFTPLLRMGQQFRRLLPRRLREHVPPRRRMPPVRPVKSERRVILVQGCVQPGLSPTTNAAAVKVFNALGIEAVTVSGEACCGAMSFHLDAQEEGREFARRNIDAWWPLLEAGAESIVMTASGCSNFVQHYDRLLADDPLYSEKAAVVTKRLRDISHALMAEKLESLDIDAGAQIAWHCPCTAQHGQKLDIPTRAVLTRLGFEVPPVQDAHLCCGSAGTYSLFEHDIADRLRQRKLRALEATAPEQIVTANIGCQVHLGAGTETPVAHWIELVARSLRSTL